MMTVGRAGWTAIVATLLCGIASPAMAAEACKAEIIATLPVTMQGLRPIVDTRIDGKPAPMILDSGAFFSTISPPVARALGLHTDPLPPNFHVSGIGGESSAGVATARHFELAGADIPHVEFIVSGTDVGQTGLLGQNVLGLGDVEYDLPGGAVRLFRANHCGKTSMAYWTKGGGWFELPIEDKSIARSHTVGTVELDGAKIRTTFDTGAGETVLTLHAAARAGVHPGDPGVEPDGWESGLGRHVVHGWIARFKLLKIGNEELHNIRLRIADLGPLDTDMLLGADYFVSHRVFVSNAQHRMYFTYTGGRLFSTGARIDPQGPVSAQGGPDASAPPTDAEGFARRGAMLQTQHDLPKAIEAYTQAMTMAPRDPRFPLQRAYAYLAQRRPVLAMDDLSTTLALDPADTKARLLRAELRIHAGNPAGAVADLDDVAGRLPREAAERLRMGTLYTEADAFDPAIAQFDQWLATHHEDAGRGRAQNGRCWARALAGKDLDAAKRDCDAAVHAMPGDANLLDSRALVALRRGDTRSAIADYDAALAIEPKRAWILYCRGLAERRAGDTAAADRDMAAATAIDRRVADRARHYGLS